MWNLDEEFDCIDLGHDFYVVKFLSAEDLLTVITAGSWKIMDHYLTIQKWKPNFHPTMGTIASIAVWIQLLGLPLEYFNEEVLVKVGKLVGRPIKLDSNTVYTTRGKFARIYIEIDLSKPLIPSIRIGNFVQNIEYEGLHNICFSCGCFGHRTEACVLKKMVTDLEELSEAVQTKNTKATSEKTDKATK
ncbi:uncharacterized protein At4g02000 [Gossypium raimondii]|uniref:uncharacterized protein At4g02000 n=1 Tax=Gossypium raimondii TaxID=29730 RepID=UPI00063A98FE|nr:uncharacterized protein At4g02000 [Gossypium raimondii]